MVLCVTLLVVLTLCGCSGRYIGTPRAAMLDYQTNSTYGSLYALATAQAESINAAVKADTLHPGMYAEYGVALALMGHDGEACRMLNSEAKAFPESRRMVRRIKERLLPAMVDDTLAGKRDTADMLKLQSWAYDSLAALRPLPWVAAVIDSTDTLRVMQQTPVDSVEYPIRLTANQKRELLVEEQRKEELRRKEIEDSIAAAKQAKIDARNQAKIDKKKAKKEKEQAKKEAEKEKEKAKKEAEKKKKEAAKEKAQQRELEKQRKAEERKARQQQQKQEQEQQRQQQKQEQEQQRQQQKQQQEQQRQQRQQQQQQQPVQQQQEQEEGKQ